MERLFHDDAQVLESLYQFKRGTGEQEWGEGGRMGRFVEDHELGLGGAELYARVSGIFGAGIEEALEVSRGVGQDD